MSRPGSHERACPNCGKPAIPKPDNSAFPFCSRRCRLLDLDCWLGESYRIPVPVTERNLVADVEDKAGDA